MKTIIKTSAVLLALVVATASSHATDVYNNLVNQDPAYGILQLNNNQPVGQQVYLDNTALSLAPYLTNFTFEYYSSNSAFSGSVQASVKFFLNDGAFTNGFQAPGLTPFYDSGLFSIYAPNSLFSGTNFAYLSFGDNELYLAGGPDTPITLGYALPQSFTVVYTISGLTGSDMIGLPVYNPSTVGTNHGNYWLQDPGNNWGLVTNNATLIGIGMQFEAAPEPSVIALAGLGGLLMTRLLRRKA